MYNKSPRFGIKWPTQTPPVVGPFTYMLDDSFILKRENVVPFGSTAERKIFDKKIYNEAFYDGRIKTTIVGGHSLRNKAKRFVYKISDVPPPGTYNPKIPGKRKLQPTGKGKIYYCRVPYTILGSAPSIPSKHETEGYEINECGCIMKNNEICYKPRNTRQNNKEFSCDTYKGCYWSRRTSKRDTFKINSGPGPADYDVSKVSTCRHDEIENEYREMARRFSYLPRFLEQLQINVQRQNLPPPNRYEIKSCFDPKTTVTTVVKPFFNNEERFKDTKKDEAFHRIYDLPNLDERCGKSVKDVPFLSCTARFKRKKVSEDRPEPELYCLKGFADENLEKIWQHHSFYKPGFASSVPRVINFVKSESCHVPASNTYPREKLNINYRRIKENSVFKSTADRFKIILNSAPPSTTYSVIQSFDKNRNKTSHNYKWRGFLATDKRRTLILPHKDKPGPAHYLGKDGIKGKGYFFDKEERFLPEVPKGPPPNLYSIHPMYGDSLFNSRKTYNLMIAESVLNTKLRKSPDETREEFDEFLKQEKKLACYNSVN